MGRNETTSAMEAGRDARLEKRTAQAGPLAGIAVLLLAFGAGAARAADTTGGLRIEVIAAHNLVVDSNVGTPSSKSPRCAYLGATFRNEGTNDLSGVFAYIGNYINGTNDTPGLYPTNRTAQILGPLPGGMFALTHEGGTAGTADAIRYLGTLAPGESVTAYWLVSYPLMGTNTSGGATPTWGASVKPDDDLTLYYDIWATAVDSQGSNVAATVTRDVTMRNEISASANKIFPNGANKVPQAYLDLLQQYAPSWTNVAANGSVGTKITIEGYWYDLGNVGEGFDNDGDFVPDRNAWMQPVGDPSIFDPSCFRLVKTHALVVVKLKTGGERVYLADDQLYFENIPENNGAVGLVLYEFVPLKAGCTSAMTPYQEVASGRDNEKFNADFGATLGQVIVSGEANVALQKFADPAVIAPGTNIRYSITFTNTSSQTVGNADLGIPLVVTDPVPTGTVFVAGSATNANVLPAGVSAYTVLYSTNNAQSWVTNEPPASQVTHVQWWLSDALAASASGTVKMTVTVLASYSNGNPLVSNTAGASLGNTTPFTNSTATTYVLGTNFLGDYVFVDNGSGTNFGNGVKDPGESGLPNIRVNLYYDLNSNGVRDATDILVGSTNSDANGYYVFTNLLDGLYLTTVDQTDADIPYGYTTTTSTFYSVGLDTNGAVVATVSYTNADFGFAPALVLTKTGTNSVREGGLVTYTIAVTNRMPGDGGAVEYMLWGTNAVEDPSNSAWLTPENAGTPNSPDGVYATVTANSNGDKLNVSGHNVASQAGAITNVEIVIPMLMVGPFNGDTVAVNLYTNGADAGLIYGSNKLASAYSSGTYVLNVTTSKVWTWADFAPGNKLVIQVLAKKAAGPGSWVLSVDQVGFRIGKTQTSSIASNAASTLNPVPVTDSYDADLLRYVSASPAPTTVTTNGVAPNSVGTLYWANMGPIYAGGAKTISVTYSVPEPPNNAATTVTNVVFVTNAMYATGRPANVDTATAATVISPAGSIGDRIWRDDDGDGVQDAGETGIVNVAVVLTPPPGVDVGNGAGKPITNYTDSTGYYMFTGLPADGVYTVRVDTATLPTGGGTFTNTWDRDGTNNSYCTNIVIDFDSQTGGDKVTNADFGYSFSMATIEGTIWHDWNRDGYTAPDVGEEWLTNVVVRLYTGGVFVATTTTGTNGYFKFTGNYTNGFTVQVYTNSGMMTNTSWTQSFDTDGISSLTNASGSVASGGVARVDFSFYRVGTVALGDLVWYDWDGDRVQDANEEGIVDVTVKLYADKNGNGVVDPLTDPFVGATDSLGGYGFYNLFATNYLVVVDEADPQFPLLYTCTADPQGALDGRSMVTLAASDRFDQDFGYRPYGFGSIGDTVWRDIDGNGVQSGPGETGISNVTVTLYVDMDTNGTYFALRTTQTTATGYYDFGSLPDGRYRVQVSTNSAGLPADSFGVPYRLTTPQTVSVTISNGTIYTAADFGFVAPCAIGDTVFWDSNRSGGQDWNEGGISGVTVRLYIDKNTNRLYDAGTDEWVANALTDVNGRYLFSGLATGRYVVAIDPGLGPIVGLTCTSDPDADGDPSGPNRDGQYGVSLGFNTAFMGADFGYAPWGVIGDRLWLDSNNNKTQDVGEAGISYVTIELWSNGVLVATNVTDGDGYYCFSGIADGTYRVVVKTNDTDFPAQLAPTYDPDGAYDDVATNILVAAGVITTVNGGAWTNGDLGIDFGYRFAGNNRLIGTVGLETAPATNGVMGTGTNGVGAGEYPYAGITLYMNFWRDVNGDGVCRQGEVEYISSTLTATNGDYSFADLPSAIGVSNFYLVSLAAPDEMLRLTTTTNSAVPSVAVSNFVDALGFTASALQIIPVAAAVTNVDFAFVSMAAHDYGDLPDSYDTVMPDGARHKVKASTNLYMGATIDTESNGSPSVAADGDGSDEDGVTPVGAWATGTNGGQVVTVVTGLGWLVGFIDFNNDGAFTNAGDLVITQSVSTGTYTNYFTVPTNAFASTNSTALYARFRLFETLPAFPALAFAGSANNGEVEDYLWLFGVVGDLVWKDTDGDGVKDADETGVAGVRVYIDRNTNGLYEVGEPYATTDTNGLYSIGGLSTGNHVVAVDTSTLPAAVTAPSYDLDGVATAHCATVTITNGQVRADVDFGYLPTAIGGQVWLDTNADGLQNETPLNVVSGITVRLYNGSSNWVASTVTGTNGLYVFNVDIPGNYFIEFFPGRYSISPKDQGGDDAQDSDVSVTAPYRTAMTTLVAGEREMDWDMGLYIPSTSNSVGDRVWLDYSRDGVQDTGESGFSGITVGLYDIASNVLDTTVTDYEGYYRFAGLAASNYLIRVTAPAGYFISPQNMPDDNRDSDVDTSTGYTAPFALAIGQVITNIDAGVYAIVDLGVTKAVDNTEPDPGGTVVFTMVVSNAGPSHATGVRFADTWPANISHVSSAASRGIYTSTDGVWTIGTLSNGFNAILTVTGTVAMGTAGTTISNVVTLSTMNEPDTNSANNRAEVLVAVAGADLAVSKIVDNSQPYEGSNVVFTIGISNRSTRTANSVTVSDTMPSGLTHVTNSASQGTYASGSGVWSVGSLASGATATLTVTASVNSATAGRSITNTATLTGSTPPDPISSNNTASAVVTVRGANLGVVKTVNDTSPAELGTVVYTIVVTNRGPNATTGVKVVDPLTNGITYVSHSTLSGTYTAASGLWDIGAMSSNGSAMLTITATVNSATQGRAITNISRITASDLPDPDTSDNSDDAVIIVSAVRITKTSSATAPVALGSNITYTIVVTNGAAVDETGVTVTDSVPAGVTYVAGSAQITYPADTNENVRDNFGAQAYTNSNGTLPWGNNWQETNENNGATAGNVQVLVDSGRTNVLRIENSAFGVWRYANLSGYRTAVLSFSYRRLGMDDAGDTVVVSVSTNGTTWTTVATIAGTGVDDGSYLTTNVNIAAYISATTYVRFLSSGMVNNDYCHFDDINIALTKRVTVVQAAGTPPDLTSGKTLLGGESLRITYSVTVNDPPTRLSITNIAATTTDNLPGWIMASVTDTVARSDLGVVKNVSTNYAGTNQYVWFTISLTNNGPQAASSIILQDVWPAGISYSNYWASTGIYQSAGGLWSNFSLAVGAGATLILTGRVNTAQAYQFITNRVQIIHLDQYDSNPANDQDDAWLQTLVVISRVEAFFAGGAGWVEWETASEIGTAGFNLYRLNGKDGARRFKVNGDLVPAVVDAPQGGVYRLPDDGIVAGRICSYVIEEVEQDGNIREYGPFDVMAQATGVAAPAGADGVPRGNPVVRVPEKSEDPAAKDFSAAPVAAAAPMFATPFMLFDSFVPPALHPVKLTVKAPGAYAVAAADVASALGDDTAFVAGAFSSGGVRLGNRGRAIPYLPSEDGMFLYFYGEAIESPHTEANVYWLTWEAGSRMAAVDGSGAGDGDVTTFRETTHFEVDRYAATSLIPEPEGDFWLWEYFTAGNAAFGRRSFAVYADGLAQSAEPASLVVRLIGATAAGRGRDHHVLVRLNGTLIGEDSWAGMTPRTLDLPFDPALLAEGSNTVEITAVLDPLVPYSTVYLDSFDLAYPRRHLAVGDRLAFRAGAAGAVVVGGFTVPDVRVLDVTTPAVPKVVAGARVGPSGASFTAAFAAEAPASAYVAFTPASARPVAGLTVDAESDLRSSANKGRHVIITIPSLAGAAERLAEHRRSRGVSSKVVLLEDIYDEFSYGIAGPHAIRVFLAHALAYWSEPPRYVVLAGEGTYDYKGVKKTGDCLVPPFLATMPRSMFATDAPYADPDGDGTADLAVGRLPVMTAAELDAVVDKIVAYETAPAAAWQSVATLSADVPDKGGNFTASSEATADLVPAGWSRAKVHLAEMTVASARSLLIGQINSGTAFLNFHGHGGMDTLSGRGLLKTADVAGLVNGNRLPIVTALSCVVGRFEIPGYDCLGEALVLRPGAGAIAVWAPSGLSYNEPSALLGRAFYRAVMQQGEGVLGEAILLAKAEAASKGCSPESLAVYNLLGDPATVAVGFDAVYGGGQAGVSLAEWKRLGFGWSDRQDEAVVGDEADPDGDGTANLAEYVFGRNPRQAEKDPLFDLTGEAADPLFDFEVRFKKNKNALDAGAEIEISGDLVTWHRGELYVGRVTVTDDGNGLTETVSAMVRTPDPEKRKGFIRLRAWKR